ncbi:MULTISPECIES: DUF262 domain-containing protein [Pseudomonas]|uniref:DUF262 domain-containing protein n=1 Tax=Pseudomonas TaxID=286 RepID=UPI000C21E586|nr:MULTISPECIES: DUF262 domain-containing protein [Pseudomonas]PJH86276.1 hypothetical protein CVG87_25940 [Pseudomonas sp. WCS365]UII16051.1 hypothetical protein LRP86_02958 [Pseudomonas brassicacearum]
MTDSQRMHIHPVHQSIADLLGGTITFEVPRYQRNYAWGPDQVSAFIKDLDQCLLARAAGERRDHFFGGIVTAAAPVQGSSRHNHELIDGQQRLVTFQILMMQLKRTMLALADTLPEDSELDAFLRQRADSFEKKYQIYSDSIQLRVREIPRLNLSVPDHEFYSQMAAGRPAQAERKSHRLLQLAYEMIGTKLAQIVASQNTDDEKATALNAVHDVFESDWTVIHMGASSRAHAYMLFQVLNDRGVSLTEAELLRSSTMEAMESLVSAAELGVVETCWDDILSGKDVDIRDALSWIYASNMGTSPNQATLLTDVQNALFPALSNESEITIGVAREIGSAVSILRTEVSLLETILRGEWPCPPHQSVTIWDRDRLRLLIVHLKQTDCMPLIISAASLLSPVTFSKVIHVLEKFCFRYLIIVEASKTEAISIFNRHAVDIRRNPAKYDPRTLTNDLRELLETHAPDDLFRDRLSLLHYPRSQSKKIVKYFLMTLEHFVNWYDGGAQGSPLCRDKVRVFDFEMATIEHVYAENATERDDELDTLLDTLGNLTILSQFENNNVGAASFAEKRAVFAASTSTLNQQIAAEPVWTAEIIHSRKLRLVEIGTKIFII